MFAHIILASVGAIAVVGAVAFLLIVGAFVISMLPSEFNVSRSASINAPPNVVFPLVNNLHKWETWSPWAKMDPNARVTYEGPEAGVDAAFSWVGNNKVGEGKMTIVTSQPDALVRFKLEFFKPMRAKNEATFTFKNENGRTTVLWAMSGRNNFFGKIFGLFINCDKMIGSQFDKGLADMKAIAERNAVAQK